MNKKRIKEALEMIKYCAKENNSKSMLLWVADIIKEAENENYLRDEVRDLKYRIEKLEEGK